MEQLGERLGAEVCRATPSEKGARIVALRGELGAGKTTFVRGFARGVRANGPVTSPTFTIMNRHSVSCGDYETLWHIDCYRLQSAGELADLDFAAVAADPSNVVMIEWADVAADIIPSHAVWVTFTVTGEGTRRVEAA